jgi:hypothetical protein
MSNRNTEKFQQSLHHDHHHPEVNLRQHRTLVPIQAEELHAVEQLPTPLVQSILVTYRSIGIGCFGAFMRFVGMPLEKIALYMNSTQVSGRNPLQQAVRLTFNQGALTPYRVVGVSSFTAWFLQYSVMGVAFQFFDQTLSELFGVDRMYYGHELMQPHTPVAHESTMYHVRSGVKTVLSPMLAGCLESFVSNRAEVQRFYGTKFASIVKEHQVSTFRRLAGPAFLPNVSRNIIMCQTSFLLTPLTYRIYFPQEYKSQTSLFWYGLGVNMFAGNVVAITQQALWGRSLDYLAANGTIQYRQVIQQGFQTDGVSAFFTGPKWFSRVLMNAPAQGTLPWFYNEVLPIFEPWVLSATKKYIYDPFLRSNNAQSSGRPASPPGHVSTSNVPPAAARPSSGAGHPVVTAHSPSS